MKRKPLAVFTAITGGYDSLKPVYAPWSAEADFIAYLDRPVAASGWEVRATGTRFRDPQRNAKQPKIIPRDLFAEYEASIWLDGSVVPKSPERVGPLVARLLGAHDLAVFRHRSRTCIYQEAQACIAAAKDDRAVIEAQVAHYRQLGYPADRGLNECTVIVRRHTPAAIAFCERWHTEIERFSRRDQLSFNFVAWSLSFDIATLPGTNMNNDHFLWVYHDAGSGVLQPVV